MRIGSLRFDRRDFLWRLAPTTVLAGFLPALGFKEAAGQSAVHPVLSPLAQGRLINLVAAGQWWDIVLLEDGQIGTHRVLSLAADHLVLQDFAGITRLWVPVSAVRSVQWTLVGGSNPMPASPAWPSSPAGPWDRRDPKRP